MNDAGQDTPCISIDEALALDYALGILVEPDLRHAQKRLREDAAFALLVSKYRVRLGSGNIDDAAGRPHAAPRAEAWQAIVAKISAPEHS